MLVVHQNVFDPGVEDEGREHMCCELWLSECSCSIARHLLPILMLIYVASRDYSVICCSGLARGYDGDLEELEGNVRVTHIKQ